MGGETPPFRKTTDKSRDVKERKGGSSWGGKKRPRLADHMEKKLRNCQNKEMQECVNLHHAGKLDSPRDRLGYRKKGRGEYGWGREGHRHPVMRRGKKKKPREKRGGGGLWVGILGLQRPKGSKIAQMQGQEKKDPRNGKKVIHGHFIQTGKGSIQDRESM